MSPDGYLPSPLILASAIAARTTQLQIRVAVPVLFEASLQRLE